MEALPRPPASFLTQTDALMRKNIVLQKRNGRANCCIILFPVLLCLLIAFLQDLVDSVLDELDTKPVNICDCQHNNSCVPAVYFQLDSGCAIPSPIKWPPLLQLPVTLPDEPCKETESCPAVILLTGDSQNVAKSLARNMFRSTARLNFSGKLPKLADFILGTRKVPSASQFFDRAFFPDETIYVLQHKCRANFSVRVPFRAANNTVLLDVKCVEALPLWRNSSSVMNDEILEGYGRGNVEGRTKEIATAYDFFNTNRRKYNVGIGYNSSYSGVARTSVMHIARSINMASNSYLRFLKGRGVKMHFEYVSEMPRLAIPRKKLQLDISSLMGVLFFFWTVELLFPVILNYLVYEKQRKLRIMMKMHGLRDGPYWIISYAYFLLQSSLYVFFLVTLGTFVGLKFFLLNSYSIQFVFYFIYINLQIALAFLVATYFSHVKTATVIGYIYVASSGFLGEALFKSFVQDSSLPRSWIVLLELFPAFSLYRGMYEFSQYAIDGLGMQWKNLNDRENGMKDVLLIMLLEWFLLLSAAYYFDQAASFGDGFRRGISFFLMWFRRTDLQTSHQPVFQQQQELDTLIEMESSDISREREVVEQLLQEPSSSYPIVCDELKKVYPGRDGNPEKIAVKGLSLALHSGECLGMLGPNGAGKTSLINMLIGFIEPTSGTAYIQGMDIRTDMNKIYSGMGVCPQYDLLWETLTGREHLMFYGRLKNLKAAALAQAVEESLESVNLLCGGVADKQAEKYSGGMKRRLSVAISLIGDPKVVYMDEPSTGLDPASRKELWNAVKRAKKDRAIILTTHSMDEAEFLCDRLGIFVDGNLKCIGNSKELKSRYGGLYRLTITTPAVEEKEVEHLVRTLSPHAYKIYQLSGTQKFEMPKQEVRISDVFQAIESAKRKLTIIAWGLADTTLEDVFIKVAKDADAFRVL